MPGPRAPSVQYSPEQQRIIAHRGGHIQVTACAGSGKTETVAMRVATLLGEGVAPESIIAFTFTKAAAASLKARIMKKVEETLPSFNLDRLSPLFVGTIHAFCLRLLQERVPRLAVYDLFEEHRLVALLTREYFTLGLDALGVKRRTDAIGLFLDTAAVVENEMLHPDTLPPGVFRDLYVRYCDLLTTYRVLTHNQCIARAVSELEDPGVFDAFHRRVRHLIVDEFQDINPAQARLIALLGRSPTNVCVVGDDDQAIYQWRGSSVAYLRDFESTFRAKVETLGVNRRSRADIVTLAASFAQSVQGRLPKDITGSREADPASIHMYMSATAESESEQLAQTAKRANEAGVPYSDMAVLLRSVRTSSAPLLAAFDRLGVRYRCTGRTGLFFHEEAQLLARFYAHVAGRNDFFNARLRTPEPVDIDTLLQVAARVFGSSSTDLDGVRRFVEEWHDAIRTRDDTDLVGRLYSLLRLLGVRQLPLDDAATSTRLGVLGRFSEVISDFESATRRARRFRRGEDIDEVTRTRGQRDLPSIKYGELLIKRLVNYIDFYAQTEYEDFAGEQDFDLDAVTVTTIHQAKGLEWPIVFVPCLSGARFPSRMTGRPRDWLMPREAFPANRYEGTDEDERRLFYVAVTRARDHLFLSTHERVTTRRVAPSPYLQEVCQGQAPPASDADWWTPQSIPARTAVEEDRPTYSFSDLALYLSCPLAYRYRANLALQPRWVKELGYGKAVHHVLRRVAELARVRVPDRTALEGLFDEEFYLPYADDLAYAQMRSRASEIVGRYIAEYSADLTRVWEVERSFELHLDNGNVVGRADVILDGEGGLPGGLALVDYKTVTHPSLEAVQSLQLGVYTAAARGEGLKVAAAYVHDLSDTGDSARRRVETGDDQIARALEAVARLIGGVRSRTFDATPGAVCQRCDVRPICPSAP